MRAIIGMIFVAAVLAGLFAVIKFMVYGVSEDFGWGFLAGGFLMMAILLPYFHFDEKARATPPSRRTIGCRSPDQPVDRLP